MAALQLWKLLAQDNGREGHWSVLGLRTTATATTALLLRVRVALLPQPYEVWCLTASPVLLSAPTHTCRDGYTDLRGRFDYVTLTSTADMSRVARYSLLVASREHGAVMLQAAPPPK